MTSLFALVFALMTPEDAAFHRASRVALDRCPAGQDIVSTESAPTYFVPLCGDPNGEERVRVSP